MSDKLTPSDVGDEFGSILEIDEIPQATVDAILERKNSVRTIPIEKFAFQAITTNTTESEAVEAMNEDILEWISQNISHNTYAQSDRQDMFSKLSNAGKQAIRIVLETQTVRTEATKRNAERRASA